MQRFSSANGPVDPYMVNASVVNHSVDDGCVELKKRIAGSLRRRYEATDR
ncbi:MAG: hypothetical protein OXC26_06195 [Albidovulum sp.]|nr:hypothetical protein [Albidovulum sp.]